MESFLISLSTVAIAEMGDRTQLLSLMLAARFRRPWPILAGVLCATLANHAAAAFIGQRLGRTLTPGILDATVGISMIAMALWTLKPDTLDEVGRVTWTAREFGKDAEFHGGQERLRRPEAHADLEQPFRRQLIGD